MKIIKQGSGVPLLVLHGWGMNSHIWQPIKSALEANFSVYWIDLPGHGINQDFPFVDMAQVSQLIANAIPNKVSILAWSLGGLIAQNLALSFPEKVAHLTLVATSPSFVQREKWQYATPPDVLQGFSENLKGNLSGTLQRFLALQFLGVKGVQKQVKILQENVLSEPPKQQALQAGLEILRSADFRNQEQAVNIHWILGKMDRLVPYRVSHALKTRVNHSVDIIANAGHAPFISHPNVFMQSLLKGYNNAG